jgi:acetyltransferase-like isoleucine patch superfamily enzyme
MVEKQITPMTFIAKTAILESDVIIDEGAQIMAGAYISKNTRIGKNCFVGYNTVIRPGVVVGDGSHIRSLCFVAENVTIGKNCKIIQLTNLCKGCIIEDDVFLGTGVLTYDTKKISHSRNYKPYGQPPYICKGARIASGVRINPGITIGMCSSVDAGSIVTHDTEAYGIYRGTPARKIGEIPKKERIYKI